MAVKLSELDYLTSPGDTTVIFALDDTINPNTSYQLQLSVVRDFVTNASFAFANSTFDLANSSYLFANTIYNYVSNVVYVQANSAYNQANVANTIATNTFNFTLQVDSKANQAFAQANSAHENVNSAFELANTSALNISELEIFSGLAFDQANTATSGSIAAYYHANLAFGSANVSYSLSADANTNAYQALSLATTSASESALALDYANSAYIRANTGVSLSTNNAFTISSAYDKANTVESDFASYVQYDKVVNVKSLGVFGNGVDDDTTSIQGIIDLYREKELYFPAGIYLFSNLNILPNTRITGTGSYTIFKSLANNTNMFYYSGDNLNNSDIVINNVSLYSNNINCLGVVISGNVQANSTCSKIYIKKVNLEGFNIGLDFNYCENIVIEQVNSICNTDIRLINSSRNRIINSNLLSSSNSIIEDSNSKFNMIYGNMSKVSPVLSGANTSTFNNIVNALI
jgi:hypothetical protein